MRTFGLCFSLISALILVGCSKNKVTAPRPLAEWVATSGPTSDYTDYIACFGVSGTSLFAGAALGGVFCSTDNGATWTADNKMGRYVLANAVGSTNLFAGT